MRIVCQFSCGAASAVATKMALAQHKNMETVIAKPFFQCEVCGLRTDNPMRAQCKGPHRSQHMWSCYVHAAGELRSIDERIETA